VHFCQNELYALLMAIPALLWVWSKVKVFLQRIGVLNVGKDTDTVQPLPEEEDVLGVSVHHCGCYPGNEPSGEDEASKGVEIPGERSGAASNVGSPVP